MTDYRYFDLSINTFDIFKIRVIKPAVTWDSYPREILTPR